MMKTPTRRVRWEKAEEEWTSGSGLISVNPSCQKSRVAAYMDMINRVVSQSTSRTTSKALVRGNHQNMTFFVFNQIFPFFSVRKLRAFGRAPCAHRAAPNAASPTKKRSSVM